MLTNPLNKEKREFRRMVMDAPVTLIHQHDRVEAICRDLSASGMAFEVKDKAFQAGDEIEVSLATASNRLPPFQAKAKVVHVVQVSGGQRVGVEFVSVG